MAVEWYGPLAQEVGEQVQSGKLKVLGISGTQGSGKSTLAGLLGFLLTQQKISVITLSLDDFYLTRAERQHLADTVHPLLATRGVPGTHDIKLATSTIEHLFTQGEVKIPRFNKATDDRLPESQWDAVIAPIDLVILEGWCLSVPPQTESQLQIPVNELESERDSDGRWRHFVNQALVDYQPLFNLIDFLIYLRSPNFEAVKRWRGRQEQKLAAKTNLSNGHQIMDEKALTFFLQHYQRLTLHGFETLPQRADVMFILNEQQQITHRINKLEHGQ